MASVLPPPSMLVQPPSLVVVNQPLITTAVTAPAPATTAAAQIRAAISKLTAMRDAAMTGPWAVAPAYGYPASSEAPASVVQGPPWNDEGDQPGYDLMEAADAALIVTLHSMIEPQLALLRSVAKGYEQFPGDVWATERNNALAIARAINGDAS